MSTGPVTRAHREAAVLAMYPLCAVDSPMWIEFVERGDEQGYRTPTAVAKAIATASLSDLEIRRSVVNAEAMTWIRLYGSAPPIPHGGWVALHTLIEQDAGRFALRALIERDADLRQIEEHGDP